MRTDSDRERAKVHSIKYQVLALNGWHTWEAYMIILHVHIKWWHHSKFLMPITYITHSTSGILKALTLNMVSFGTFENLKQCKDGSQDIQASQFLPARRRKQEVIFHSASYRRTKQWTQGLPALRTQYPTERDSFLLAEAFLQCLSPLVLPGTQIFHEFATEQYSIMSS